jgi:hypothetical protein
VEKNGQCRQIHWRNDSLPCHDSGFGSQPVMSQLPYRITCSQCGSYRPLIDFRHIDMTNPELGRSLFRHSFVTAFQALMEVNLLRAWAFEYDHKMRCGKKAVCRVEQEGGF